MGTTKPAAAKPLPPERRRALDPFFIFTYTLVALAAAIQIVLMVWMDFF